MNRSIGPAAIAALLVAGAAFTAPPPAAAPIALTVYKDPSCGCCTQWVAHLRAAGFRVSVVDTTNLEPVKARYHVTPALASCHTATVAGTRYVIEGHVPADLIAQLMRDQPNVAGLAVPGMVAGSPGMDSPNPQPYDVVSFDSTGKTAVFARR